ncbi:MAG: Trk system potassium transporter TrkA [Bacteroidales bacterium]|nr:Trk system potassium transporter TrkA [Bacteroidales bacterium]MDD2322059.1 Trk system potassium transporter TrkA [Bacteroidales bacterium]MDD3009729.1 Trk system potassium transporter TrkA [Bacteroidales bacterium]MDD3960676.1 Trk system potassium transporter TrkA [Bacteroidales bacterium]MDY0284998.1 Trk system potassium transporter TrkA [Bacteroidales bacterium]
MNILIAGDGEVGFHLAKMLSGDNHNITIVDPNQELLKMIESHSDLLSITGDSTSVGVLERANVHKADLVIAVVHDEKTNILTCILSKKLGAKKTICRVNNLEYLEEKNLELFREMGIDELVCPERIAANEIIHLFDQAAATEVVDFSNDKLSLFLIRLEENAKVIGRSLMDIARSYPDLPFRAVAIHRNSHTIIPKGCDQFEVGDLAYVICKREGIPYMLELSGKSKVDIKNVMIIGGGRIGRKTARLLEKKLNLKLIEIDKNRCINLTDSLSNTLVINGDARDVDLLDDEGIRSMDAFVAVTNNSETNILTCMLARKMGVKKVIALVENVDYIDLAQRFGVDTVINKKLITASYIVRFTMDADVTFIRCLNGIDAEAIELIAKPNSPITKQPIKKLNFPKGAIIGGIVRGEESFIATGDFQIQENDNVVVFSLPESLHKVNRLFKSYGFSNLLKG